MQGSVNLQERLRFLRSLRVALLRVREDQNLRDLGVKVLVAVDFSAIYSYMHSVTQGRAVFALASEPEPRVQARELLALEILFAGDFAQVILIPPYAVELRNHIAALKAKLWIAKFDVRNATAKKLEHLVRTSEEFGEFRRHLHARNRVEEGETAVEVCREFFPELFMAIRLAGGGGLEKLRELFQSGRLEDCGVVAPWMLVGGRFADDSRIDYWSERIAQLRKGERAYESRIDGWACSLIESANSNNLPSRRAVILVSPSTHVQEVLSGHRVGCGELGFQGVECFRDLSWVLVSKTHGHSREMVRESLESIDGLIRVYEDVDTLDDEMAAKRLKVMESVEPTWRAAQNRFLMEGLADDTEKRDAGDLADSELVALLGRVVQAIVERSFNPTGEALEILESLWTKTRELDKWLPRRESVNAMEEIEGCRLKGGHYLRLPGLPGELGMQLVFRDSGVLVKARRLNSPSHGEVSGDLVELRRQLIAEASGEHANPEDRLLAAYLLACEERFRVALEYVEAGLRDSVGETSAELAYLGAVLCRRRYRSDEAIAFIGQALERSPSETRYLLEKCKAHWVGAVEAERDGDGGRVLELIEAAIAAFREAIDSTHNSRASRQMLLELENAGAFLYSERYVRDQARFADDLRTAEDHLQRLMQQAGEDGWTSRLRDTHGCVLYARAMSADSPGDGQRLALLSEARECVQRAHADAGPEARKWLLDFHLKRIDDALALAQTALPRSPLRVD